jgi:hypothetical protein
MGAHAAIHGVGDLIMYTQTEMLRIRCGGGFPGVPVGYSAVYRVEPGSNPLRGRKRTVGTSEGAAAGMLCEDAGRRVGIAVQPVCRLSYAHSAQRVVRPVASSRRSAPSAAGLPQYQHLLHCAPTGRSTWSKRHKRR